MVLNGDATGYLIDTHVFLFWLFGDRRLSKRATKLIQNPVHSIHISSISFWEIALKHKKGKLSLSGITPSELPAVAQESNFTLLSLNPLHAASYAELPETVHKDPFDRLLIWQAIQLSMPLISRDGAFVQYEEYGLQVVY